MKKMVFFLFLLLNVTACTSKTKRIKVVEKERSLLNISQYIAHQMGYFEEQQLDVELETAENASEIFYYLHRKGADIIIAGPEESLLRYSDLNENYPIVLAQLAQKSEYYLMSDEPHQMDWERIFEHPLLSDHQEKIFQRVFTRAFTPKSHVINFYENKIDFNIRFFMAGKAKFMFVKEPFASILELKNIAYKQCLTADYLHDYPVSVLLTSAKINHAKQEELTRYMKAIYQAQRYIAQEDAASLAALLAPYFPETNEQMLSKIITEFKNKNMFSKSPVVEKNQLIEFQMALLEEGLLKKTIPYEKLVNGHYAQVAEKN